jgi:hypothetical protein
VLFFALTGAVQLLGLHEAGEKYQPPRLIEKLSMVHKDQVFAQPRHHEERHGESPSMPEKLGQASEESRHPQEHEAELTLGTLVLKGYFLLVAAALAASSLLGLWIGLRPAARSRTAWWLLAAGTAIPATLVFF